LVRENIEPHLQQPERSALSCKSEDSQPAKASSWSSGSGQCANSATGVSRLAS
jgi:hypothetical protein